MLNFEELIKKCGKLLPADCELSYRTAIESNAKNILEIGSGYWCSASGIVLAHAAKETGGHVWTIDPRHESSWDDHVKSYNIGNYITKVIGKSPWVHQFSSLMMIKELDYLFIDGDHDPLAIITDFQYWEKYVKKGGVIAFHDWNESETGKEVKRAIRFVRDYRNLKEIGRVDVGMIRGMIAFRKEW